MLVAVAWLDREHARIFRVSEERMERHMVRARGQELYRQVLEHLRGATHILILGPGKPKVRLHEFIIESDQGVAARVAGVEEMEHPTDPEIAERASRFFKLKPARS